MSTASITLSALWCDQGMAHMLRLYDKDGDMAPSGIVLIDFGAETMFKASDFKRSMSAPAVNSVIAALYLQIDAGKTPTLDYVVISHQDTDHWSLLNYLMDAVDVLEIPLKVNKIIYSGSDWGDAAKRAVERLSTYGVTEPVDCLDAEVSDYRDANGEVGALFTIGDVTFRLLIANAVAAAKSKTPALRKNGTSAVVIIDYRSERMILPGDATWQTLGTANTILKQWTNSPLIPVKVVGAPHHGSLDTMTEKNSGADSNLSQLIDFTRLTQPEAVVASAGFNNSFKHPYLLILKVLAKHAGSGALGPHSTVAYQINTSDWVQHDNVEKNVYTTILNLLSPVLVADYLFTRNDAVFITECLPFYGPTKANISPPYIAPQQLEARMEEAMDESSDAASTPPDVFINANGLNCAPDPRPNPIRRVAPASAPLR